MEEKRIYIHYGAAEFEPGKVGKIKNTSYPFTKPIHKCGMWASPIDSVFGWKDWCKREEFYNEKEFEKSFFFTLKNEARVIHIREEADLFCLPHRKDVEVSHNVYSNYYIDFEELARQYDAIELHITDDSRLYYKLYGWDCDSILVMNPDIVEVV